MAAHRLHEPAMSLTPRLSPTVRRRADMHRFRALLALIAVLSPASACGRPSGQSAHRETATDAGTLASPSPSASRLDPARADSIGVVVRGRIADATRPAGVSEHRWQHVRRLYGANADGPLWMSDAGLSTRARALVDAVSHADEDGLSVAAYPLAALDSAVARGAAAARAPAASAADADILLTSTFVAYAEDMLRGQVDPRTVQPAWHIRTADVDIDSALARVMRAGDFGAALAALRPDLAGYDRLRQALGRYREIAAEGDWPRIPDGPTLRPGDTSAAVPVLRRRLAAEGYSSGDAVGDSSVYDAALAGAVADFQARHGLAADSALGPATRRSLGVSAAHRAMQIVANLERYRWLPHDLGGRYLLINIPAFYLGAFETGKPVLQMRVVVGRDYGGRATPIFSDSMSYAIFDPYWNVPASIARREILPQAYRDPSYLTRNGYEVVQGWGPVRVIPLSQLSRSDLAPVNFRYRIRQKPGPRNALGRVKFIFPNDYNVYLHDTPESQLFGERVRAFSHGCIRVEKPAQLAAFVLGPQGWTTQQADSAMNAGRWRRVDLERKLPVYIAYFTAFARGSELAFRPDLYGQDDRLIRALGDIRVAPGAPDAAERLDQQVRD